VLPFGITRVATFYSDPAGVSPRIAIEQLREFGVQHVLVAGNFIEDDVVGFATLLIGASIEPIVLFDVCGTQDPMAKWQALAAIVDQGARVSTVQQTLKQISNDVTDASARARLLAILNEGLGEHAVELSAA
jgi:hypothetical protein